MKIAITGGAGFIGSHVADAYIAAGHDVVIIDNFSSGNMKNVPPQARVVELDITSPDIDELFRTEQFDVLNHHAAQIDVRVSVKSPMFDATQNIIGGLNLYEAAVRHGVGKIIFASSGGTVYGDQEVFPAGEEHPTRPCSPYGIAKLSNEHYLFYYAKQYGVNYVALRYGNVYGPRQNPHGEAGVVAIFVKKMLNGEQPIINGDGLKTRDYVFVGDVARANLLALNDSAQGAYNVGTATETDVTTIFRHLQAIINPDCPEIHGDEKPGEQLRSVISYERIKRELGWNPEVEFMQGLEKTVAYFRG